MVQMDRHLDHLIHEELEANRRDGSVVEDLTCYYQPWIGLESIVLESTGLESTGLESTGLESIVLEETLVSDVAQKVEEQHYLNPS